VNAIVIDASVASSWCFDDEASLSREEVGLLFDTFACHVPAIFRVEVANAINVGVRRGRLTEARAMETLEHVQCLVWHVDPPDADAMVASFAIARRHGLTMYDATYVELARRLGIPLASNDRDVRRSAAVEGVTIVDLGG
jgi:predicted nucleic acid-binding protein